MSNLLEQAIKDNEYEKASNHLVNLVRLVNILNISYKINVGPKDIELIKE
jgi:hypothetical protein